MNKILPLIYMYLCVVQVVVGQELNFKSVRPQKKVKDSILSNIKLYKIINIQQYTTHIDTTLTIKTAYKHNPLRKDLFGYLPMANEGGVLQELSVSDFKNETSPLMGAVANTHFLLNKEDVLHYNLPSPITEFHFKTAMEQGQMLHSLFSANISPELNLLLKYQSLRSDGKYQRSYNNFDNFVLGASYASKEGKYFASGHFAYQTIEREESGGLERLEQFTQGEAQFNNRGGVDIVLPHALSNHYHRRWFLQHGYNFLRKEAAINQRVLLKHTIEYASQNYAFSEAPPVQEGLSNTYVTRRTFDQIHLKELTTRLGAELLLPYLGRSFVYGKAYNYNYHLEKLLIKASGEPLLHNIQHTEYGLGFLWQTKYKGLDFNVAAEQMLVGKLLGSLAKANVNFKFQENMMLQVGTELSAVSPSFNKLLYVSDYKSYHWNNTSLFGNERTQILFGELITPWVVLSAEMVNKWNHTVFKQIATSESLIPTAEPYQATGAIQHYKLKAQKEFALGKFALDNTLLFQGVSGSEATLHLPAFITRNTLYYQNFVFKKAMFLQTGITFNYFTAYYANAYNPLLAEWVVQNSTKVGNYPVFDFFINAKVRTMRIYFTIEHLNASFSAKNYFTAPTYPYRDMSFRLGVSWNFFS